MKWVFQDSDWNRDKSVIEKKKLTKQFEEKMFPSCLLNKSLKIKKEEKKAT